MFKRNSQDYLSLGRYWQKGGAAKMDLTHETINRIFSEQLRRLPIKGGGEDKGSPKLILLF